MIMIDDVCSSHAATVPSSRITIVNFLNCSVILRNQAKVAPTKFPIYPFYKACFLWKIFVPCFGKHVDVRDLKIRAEKIWLIRCHTRESR